MKRIKKFFNMIDKKTILIVIVLTVFTMAPLIFQGIICNDELQTRFLRKQGMLELIKDNISTATAKGRTIGGYVDVRQFSFLTNDMYVNRLIDILLILLLISLFSYFIYRVNGNKAFSYFVGIALMVCLPVTFEHGAPNAFVAITVIPAILVVTSFLLFWSYLSSLKKKYLFFSMIPYLIAMMQYEFVVTYVLIFYALALKSMCKKDKINWLELIKKSAVPTIITLLYICAYFFVQQFNQSNYAGNTMGFVSFKSSLDILSVLAKSSIPGYFLSNDKYKYLKLVYTDNFLYKEFLNIIIGIIILVLICVMISIYKKNADKSKKWNCFEMLVAAVYIFIPAFPNAISSMYQGAVTETFFTWLPVSIFLYLAATFFVSSIIWNVLKCRNKYIITCGVILFSWYIGQIQRMNYVIANQQHNDFTRLQNIEGMFDMNIWKHFNGAEIQAKDIYETRNLLAVHEGFWTQYMMNNGVNINFKSEPAPLDLYFLDDEFFVLANDKACIVISPKALKGCQAIRVSEEQYLCAEFEQGIEDSGYYLYSYIMDGFQANTVPVENAVTALINNQ